MWPSCPRNFCAAGIRIGSATSRKGAFFQKVIWVIRVFFMLIGVRQVSVKMRRFSASMISHRKPGIWNTISVVTLSPISAR